MRSLNFSQKAIDGIKMIKSTDSKAFSELQNLLRDLKNKGSFGLPLQNKYGYNLEGCFKIYFGRRKYRIVYTIENNKIDIFVLNIGEREDLKAYEEAHVEFTAYKSGNH